MMHRTVSALLAPALLLLAPSAGTAQTMTEPPQSATSVAVTPAVATIAAPAVASTPADGPVAETRAVALRARTTPTPAPAPLPRGNTSQNRALMIVGGVGLLVGAVVGGDAGTIVMLGSAGVGLWGLYRFLN